MIVARLAFHRDAGGAEAPKGPPLFLARLATTRTRIGRTDDCDVMLPDEQVSRSHCMIDQTGDGWQVVDRSRNGTFLNGERVTRARLNHGDRLRVGPFVAVVDLEAGEAPAPTERGAPLDRRDEEVIDASDGLALAEATLLVTDGPGVGHRYRLKGARVGVGGFGSRVVLPDPVLLKDHVRVRLIYGRTLLEPGEGAAFLGPGRVRDILPLYPGEECRVGNTTFTVEWVTRRDDSRAQEFGELVARSDAMCSAFGMLRRMAAHHAPVLLIGESGTGKELAAHALHGASPRADGPFVALNCGAITPTLFESELFGHEKGAFTGATERRDGAFQRADKGTLFLDEVGELPEEAQAKLLRALESGEVRRVGAATPTWPDARIVAATNRNLAEAVKQGKFRGDLYFRLAVLAVRLPPLRERPEDIPAIAEAVVKRLHPTLSLAPDAVDLLTRHPWPGNARELRNVLTRAWVLGGEAHIAARHIAFDPLDERAQAVAPKQVEDDERELIEEALRRHGGNRSQAARTLGMARSTLLYKLRRWGLEG